MEQGILKLTEKPAVDFTNGSADSLAEDVIRQMEEIASILRQGNLFFEEDEFNVIVEDYGDAKKILKLVVIARKMATRLLRGLKKLEKGVMYLDLGVFADLQTAWKELGSTFDVSSTYLTSIDITADFTEEDEARYGERLDRELARIDDGDDEDERQANIMMEEEEDIEIEKGRLPLRKTRDNFGRITDFEPLVLELLMLFEKIGETVIRMKANFNEARQQRVLPREAVGEETASSMSGGVYRRPVYRVGNHVLSAMYDLDGLPRFI
jgi:hypothetical protein